MPFAPNRQICPLLAGHGVKPCRCGVLNAVLLEMVGSEWSVDDLVAVINRACEVSLELQFPCLNGKSIKEIARWIVEGNCRQCACRTPASICLESATTVKYIFHHYKPENGEQDPRLQYRDHAIMRLINSGTSDNAPTPEQAGWGPGNTAGAPTQEERRKGLELHAIAWMHEYDEEILA